MKYELVKLSHLSGNKASIYAIWFEGLNQTSFEIFTNENRIAFKSEINDITSRLITIGKAVGAREQFFKPGEGIPGDGVCALYNEICFSENSMEFEGNLTFNDQDDE